MHGIVGLSGVVPLAQTWFDPFSWKGYIKSCMKNIDFDVLRLGLQTKGSKRKVSGGFAMTVIILPLAFKIATSQILAAEALSPSASSTQQVAAVVPLAQPFAQPVSRKRDLGDWADFGMKIIGIVVAIGGFYYVSLNFLELKKSVERSISSEKRAALLEVIKLMDAPDVRSARGKIRSLFNDKALALKFGSNSKDESLIKKILRSKPGMWSPGPEWPNEREWEAYKQLWTEVIASDLATVKGGPPEWKNNPNDALDRVCRAFDTLGLWDHNKLIQSDHVDRFYAIVLHDLFPILKPFIDLERESRRTGKQHLWELEQLYERVKRVNHPATSIPPGKDWDSENLRGEV